MRLFERESNENKSYWKWCNCFQRRKKQTKQSQYLLSIVTDEKPNLLLNLLTIFQHYSFSCNCILISNKLIGISFARRWWSKWSRTQNNSLIIILLFFVAVPNLVTFIFNVHSIMYLPLAGIRTYNLLCVNEPRFLTIIENVIIFIDKFTNCNKYPTKHRRVDVICKKEWHYTQTSYFCGDNKYL